MTVDLDALEALAKAARERGYGDVTRVSSLIDALESTLAELRQERERNTILAGSDSDERDALITDPLVRRIQQERERADKGWRTANELNRMHRECHAQRDKAQAALSRAEETIEKVRDIVAHNGAGQDWRIRRALTEYDKQKEADRG